MTDKQISRLVDHLDIENFRKNKSVNKDHLVDSGDEENKFIRKGTSRSWKRYFDEEMIEQADKWIADGLRGSDLKFITL